MRKYLGVLALFLIIGGISYALPENKGQINKDPVINNADQMVLQGREIFRSDTFGDEAFWGDTLKIHQAIAGSANGGVGPGVSPNTALAVGLKVDVDSLPQPLVQKLKQGNGVNPKKWTTS